MSCVLHHFDITSLKWERLETKDILNYRLDERQKAKTNKAFSHQFLLQQIHLLAKKRFIHPLYLPEEQLKI